MAFGGYSAWSEAGLSSKIAAVVMVTLIYVVTAKWDKKLRKKIWFSTNGIALSLYNAGSYGSFYVGGMVLYEIKWQFLTAT